MRYIPIFCEHKRKADLESWTFKTPQPQGRCYATLTDGVWRCTCCKTEVRVVWW